MGSRAPPGPIPVSIWQIKLLYTPGLGSRVPQDQIPVSIWQNKLLYTPGQISIS